MLNIWFMRFSWGKIWFDRFPPCKQYDILQFWTDSPQFFFSLSTDSFDSVLTLYWDSVGLKSYYQPLQLHCINALQNLISVFWICVYLQSMWSFFAASDSLNQLKNSCSDCIYSDLFNSFFDVFLKIGISRSLIIAMFTLFSIQN